MSPAPRTDARRRCSWPKSELDVAYHDAECGVPVHDDRVLFEFLTLEGAQAGLSWSTILARREGDRGAFADFDPKLVARFTRKRIDRIVTDPGGLQRRLDCPKRRPDCVQRRLECSRSRLHCSRG